MTSPDEVLSFGRVPSRLPSGVYRVFAIDPQRPIPDGWQVLVDRRWVSHGDPGEHPLPTGYAYAMLVRPEPDWKVPKPVMEALRPHIADSIGGTLLAGWSPIWGPPTEAQCMAIISTYCELSLATGHYGNHLWSIAGNVVRRVSFDADQRGEPGDGTASWIGGQ